MYTATSSAKWAITVGLAVAGRLLECSPVREPDGTWLLPCFLVPSPANSGMRSAADPMRVPAAARRTPTRARRRRPACSARASPAAKRHGHATSDTFAAYVAAPARLPRRGDDRCTVLLCHLRNPVERSARHLLLHQHVAFY
jgi:hypothetical protein